MLKASITKFSPMGTSLMAEREARRPRGPGQGTSWLWRRLLPHVILGLNSEDSKKIAGLLPGDEEVGAGFRLTELIALLFKYLEAAPPSTDDFFPGDKTHGPGTENTVCISMPLQDRTIEHLIGTWSDYTSFAQWVTGIGEGDGEYTTFHFSDDLLPWFHFPT